MEDRELKRKKALKLFNIYIAIDLVILILSIMIPYLLVRLNQEINGCGHHSFSSTGAGATFWIWGRSLGFTCLIWFFISIFRGYTTKINATKFKSIEKAKNLHCYEALLTIIILAFHIIFLVTSEPWRSLIRGRKVAHFSFYFFSLKIWTGIFYGIIMVGASMLFFSLKNIKNLKRFGYKKMIWVHRIMLLFSIVLIIHISLINTELWLMSGEIGEADD
ncbi:MAG: hypothetical protein ACFFDK_16270 [Promethearchaeota archaeon]